MEEAIINFESYNIDKFIYSYEPIENMNFEDFEEDFNLNVSPSLTEDSSSGLLTVEVRLKAKGKYIFIRLLAFFSIGEKFKKESSKDYIEKILVVNGTAIVFPYLRSTVSMVSSLDSEEVIVLPTINTTALVKSELN